MKKKNAIPIIVGISLVIGVGIAYTGLEIEDHSVENQSSLGHPDAIVSGPLVITQYEFMISDNIYMIVSGLEEHEKGNIRVFMPDGRLYKTFEYDGSIKDGYNVYFKPDTSKARGICEQEELVGKWPVMFDNNVYPPLEFEIINEHRNGPNSRLPKSC
jgi:hypothetical protein